ncbi:sugar nucleotide-binding protein [Patescibacteria group bacterium]|nr:sugar nucleotide-binding protein [Patescibacteria group bacterium]
MKTIAITAPTGMLGGAVYNVLKDKYNLVLIFRNAEKINILNKVYGDIEKHKKIQFDLNDIYQDYLDGFPKDDIGPNTKKFLDQVGSIDAFINCAGIIKPYSTKKPATTLFINSCLPHILSHYYKDKLIQITTDCVYDGLQGAPYNEHAQHNPNDLYGLSKSLGEPSRDSLVLRTSIIGPEIHSFVSLIEWLKKQEGQTIQGFTTHMWNGITTRQFGRICDKIITERNAFPKNGLFHIFSNDVSKYEMITAFKDKYKVNVKIESTRPNPVDRRLSTIHSLCSELKIPSFKQMVDEI